jgi:DNA invertase Pin-like site-specific DNA recombinase
MLIGYARVSTQDQGTAAQIGTLKDCGCGLIFEEKAAGGRWDRPELHRLMEQLRKGDVSVVWKLDRLSRSLRDLLVLEEIINLVKSGKKTAADAARLFNVHPSTVSRLLRRNKLS